MCVCLLRGRVSSSTCPEKTGGQEDVPVAMCPSLRTMSGHVHHGNPSPAIHKTDIDQDWRAGPLQEKVRCLSLEGH